MIAHAPIKRPVQVAGIGRRFVITCPPCNSVSKPLDAEDARAELERHAGVGEKR